MAKTKNRQTPDQMVKQSEGGRWVRAQNAQVDWRRNYDLLRLERAMGGKSGALRVDALDW